MPASLTRPLPFTIDGADQIASAPAINTADNRPGMVWRSNGGSNAYIVVDLGPYGTAWDTVAIVGSNLLASEPVQVRSGNSRAAVDSASGSSVASFTGTKPEGFTSKTIVTMGTRTDRFVRIDFGTTRQIEVQRIVIGPSITSKGLDYDAEYTILDTSNVETNLGVDTIENGLKKIKWKFTMSAIDAANFRNAWIGFLSTVGKTTPVLFNPFVEDPSNYQADAIFGRIRNDASGKIPGTNIRVVELTIESLSI